MRKIRARGLTKKKARLVRLALVCAALAGLFVCIDARLRPVITTMAQYQCRVASVLAMNEAIMQELSETPDVSQTLSSVKRAEDGTVVSIVTNATQLNALKARLTQAVSERLMALQKQDVCIPLGTLLGWQLLAGRGPDVRLQIVPASFVQTSVEDTLETAGINQTQHRIVLRFSVEMSALLPGYSTSVSVYDDVCVSETLIVGDVPQFYAVAQ